MSAQSILYTHDLGNPSSPATPTVDIAAGGDIDGDGVADYAFRVAGPTPGVTLISGRSGKVLRTVRAGVANELGRHMTIIRDVDADGADDLLLGAPLDATRGAGAGASTSAIWPQPAPPRQFLRQRPGRRAGALRRDARHRQ